MMLDLRRLRLLHELHERGTIAAVADALQFTPSAVSQQLAVLEREAGVPLLERAGRGVRLTDAALVLVTTPKRCSTARRWPRRTSPPRRERRGARPHRGVPVGALHLAFRPSDARPEAPRLRCELVEAEPEDSLPAWRSATSTSSSPTSGSTSRIPACRRRPPRPHPRRGADRPARAAPVARHHQHTVPLVALGRRGLDDRPRRDGLG